MSDLRQKGGWFGVANESVLVSQMRHLPIIASSLRVMVEHGVFDYFGFNRKSDEMFAHITMEIHDTYKQHRQAHLQFSWFGNK